MSSNVAFLAGFFVAGITVFITTAVYVWKPRLEQLMVERDVWRERALRAEDNANPNNPDIHIVGDWGTATSWDD